MHISDIGNNGLALTNPTVSRQKDVIQSQKGALEPLASSPKMGDSPPALDARKHVTAHALVPEVEESEREESRAQTPQKWRNALSDATSDCGVNERSGRIRSDAVDAQRRGLARTREGVTQGELARQHSIVGNEPWSRGCRRRLEQSGGAEARVSCPSAPSSARQIKDRICKEQM